MATGRIYVNGSKLFWANETGTRTYSFQGALTTSSIFTAQPAGRVWVASATTDLFLYYSDELGVTRFIQGTDIGVAGSAAVGTISVQSFPCPDDVAPGEYAPDIHWVSAGPSNNRLLFARSESTPDMQFIELRTEIVQLGGTNNFEYRMFTSGYVPLLETMSLATSSLAPYYLQFYSDNSCVTPLTANNGETKWAQLPSASAANPARIMRIPGPPLQRGSDPATPWFTTASLNIGSTINGLTPQSMNVVFPTMSIYPNNDVSRVTEQYSGSIFCNGGDLIKLNQFMFGQSVYTCIPLAAGGSTTSPTTAAPTTTPGTPTCTCANVVEESGQCSEGCPYAGVNCNGLVLDPCYNGVAT
jgi:hypothetical protein